MFVISWIVWSIKVFRFVFCLISDVDVWNYYDCDLRW